MARTNPNRPGGRFGSVSEGALVEVPMLGIPAFHRIGAPLMASARAGHGPIATRSCLFAANLVAAVWPPSALHWASSATSLIACPRSVPPMSPMAISTARF